MEPYKFSFYKNDFLKSAPFFSLKVVVFLLFVGITIVVTSCGSTKKSEKNYYQVQLSSVADYQRKMDMTIRFLANYENEAEDICNTVITDLTVFEEDIKSELNENDNLSIQQVDSMRVLWHQATSLRRFMDCMAYCSDLPTITAKELQTAIQLLQFQQKTVFSTHCSQTIEISKEKFLFYFLVNTTSTARAMRYSYFSLTNDAKTGLKNIPAQEAAPIFGVFNDYYTNWINMKSVSCN